MDLAAQDAGCSWSNAGGGFGSCVGTAASCSDPLYQQNSTACENVGCTLTEGCRGGTPYTDCSTYTTSDSCNQDILCGWSIPR